MLRIASTSFAAALFAAAWFVTTTTAALGDLAAGACVLGCAIAAFVGGVHALVLEANAAVPPRLPGDRFTVLLVAFLAAFALWLGAFWWHYRRAPR